MKKIDILLDQLGLENHITLEDIPDIDLYMDQVIQLFEKKYKQAKRDENEKILTKTMINNYAKGNLFIPIKNKKYSREHLILISLIYQLKGILSISDIKTVLDGVNNKLVEDDFHLDNLYTSYLHLISKNAEYFKIDIEKKLTEVNEEVKKIKDEDTDHIEHILLITSLVNISNMYRRLAEKLVDSIQSNQEE